MYDPTIHAKSIARHLRKSDFLADKNLYTAAHREAVIAEAVKLGREGFSSGVTLRTNLLRGKNVYQIIDVAPNLVLRHVGSNIRRVTSVKQDDRSFIISCLKSLLAEGLRFRVYKFDIKSFYETVDVRLILHQLKLDVAFSSQSVRALQSFFEETAKAGIPGLPRGLGLSAILAEYLLRPFDRALGDNLGVWFYARFVDDIVIVTDSRENAADFVSLAVSALPKGLVFNRKSKQFDFTEFLRTNGNTVEHSFDFVGYNFSVEHITRRASDSKSFRTVSLDIAPSKVRRIKTRIAKSMIDYQKTGNYVVLASRIRLLTSNFNYEDPKTGVRRTSGIYFNYPMVDHDKSDALVSLDRFLRNIVMSPHGGNTLRPAVTKSQRQDLVKLTFVSGFLEKRFYSFGSKRLAALTACWAYA
jgi:hypothetical protein